MGLIKLKFNFKYKNKAFRFFACAVCLIFVGVKAYGALRTVEEQMSDIDWNYQQARKLLRSDHPYIEASENFEKLNGFFVELKASYRSFYGGRQEDWVDYCDRVLMELASAGAFWKVNDKEAAAAAFHRFESLRDHAHADFRPGFLVRIKRFFSKKKNKKNKEKGNHDIQKMDR